MQKRTPISGLGVLAALVLPACSTVDSVSETVDTATDAAVHGVTGKRPADPAPTSSPATHSNTGATTTGAMPPPMALRGYAMGIFQALFYQGGYHMAVANFEEGDYVRYKATGYGNKGEWFEKALLKRKDDDKEWWQITTNTGNGDKIIMEALFSAPDKRQGRQILRLRAKWPDQKAQEVPITKEQSNRWVLRAPRELTEASYKGLKQGISEVTVPAGTFQADHLATSPASQSGTLNWWLANQVPGGIVKFQVKGEDQARGLTLKDYGHNRTQSRLGAF